MQIKLSYIIGQKKVEKLHFAVPEYLFTNKKKSQASDAWL